MLRYLTIIFLLITQSALSFAGNPNQVGTIVKKFGKAELFTSPSKNKVQGKGPHALFEGIYYKIQPLRPGTKVKNGDIVKTGKKSMVKLVYKNGDQITVGQASWTKVSWHKNPKAKKTQPVLNLIYGSIRGVISKKGPRNRLKIKSKSAVMGVRGTDFFIKQDNFKGDLSVSVLRGQVSIAKKKTPKKITKVTQGFTAELQKKSKIQIQKTSKVDLVAIQKRTKIVSKTKVKDPIVKKEIIALEKVALKTTLEDIKEYDKKLYAKIIKKKLKSVDDVNTVVVSTAFKKAPAKKKKANMDDIDLDSDVYKKYFKLED
jgi:hypothetical protein